MIIADKLEVLNQEGDVNSKGVTYSRFNEDSYCKQLCFEGVTNIYDNVAMTTDGDRLLIQENNADVENARNVYIGDKIGVVRGADVKLGVVFIDGGFYVDILKGFINIGSDSNDFIYESYLDATDVELLDSDRNLATEWVKHNSLKDTLNAVVKDNFKVVETMFELEISVDYGGVVSTKIVSRTDISNGRIEERERAKQQEIADKELRREAKLEAERLKKQTQIDRIDKKEADAIAKRGSEMQDLFKNLIG